MELDPYYVDAILKRVQAAFGLEATLAASGQAPGRGECNTNLPRGCRVTALARGDDEPKPIRSARRATLLRSVALGRRWLQELVSGKVADPAEIASREGRSTRSVYMTVSLAFLDPALVEAAVAGRLPHGIGARRLMGLPASWAAQWKVLGLVRPN